MIAYRIITDIVLLVFLVVSPWWFIVGITICALIYFEWYIEALFVGFILDSLYGVGGFSSVSFLLLATIALIISLYGREWVRIS